MESLTFREEFCTIAATAATSMLIASLMSVTESPNVHSICSPENFAMVTASGSTLLVISVFASLIVSTLAIVLCARSGYDRVVRAYLMICSSFALISLGGCFSSSIFISLNIAYLQFIWHTAWIIFVVTCAYFIFVEERTASVLSDFYFLILSILVAWFLAQWKSSVIFPLLALLVVYDLLSVICAAGPLSLLIEGLDAGLAAPGIEFPNMSPTNYNLFDSSPSQSHHFCLEAACEFIVEPRESGLEGRPNDWDADSNAFDNSPEAPLVPQSKH